MNKGMMCTYEQKKAGAERVLRQTLGSGGRHPHGADRVSHGGGEVGAAAMGDAMRETASRCRQARQEDPRKQSYAWGRSANNTKSVHLGLVIGFPMSYTFKDQIGSVALFLPPSSSPGW